MRVLVVNAGSSSLKLRLLDAADAIERSADLPAGPDGLDTSGLAGVLRGWPEPDVVGHRIVHGGTAFTGPVLIDDAVRQQLRDLTDLAPLHQPKSLAALDAVTAQLPGVTAVACFDTAFHTTIPAAAATYAMPREWRQRYAIRRYGFHGLSHAYCSRRAARAGSAGRGSLRIITCHLGAGASLAAVLDGRSVDTTMGFTPLEGLVMATRSGTVDPGLVLWLEEHEHLSPHEVATALESALRAARPGRDRRHARGRGGRGPRRAGRPARHRRLHPPAGRRHRRDERGHRGRRRARVHRRRGRALGPGPAASGRAAGVPRRRHRPRPQRRRAAATRDITAAGATVRTLVITAREDLQIAGEARRLLAGQR